MASARNESPAGTTISVGKYLWALARGTTSPVASSATTMEKICGSALLPETTHGIVLRG